MVEETMQIEEAEERDIEKLQDLYDLMELGSRVNSKSEILNRDYTLAYTSEPIETWGNRQILLAQLMKNIMQPIDNTIEMENLKRWQKHQKKPNQIPTEQEIKKMRSKYADTVKDMLIHETTTRLIFTRSRDGRVLKAILRPQQNDDSDKEQMGFLAKMFGSKPKKKEDEQEGDE